MKLWRKNFACVFNAVNYKNRISLQVQNTYKNG